MDINLINASWVHELREMVKEGTLTVFQMQTMIGAPNPMDIDSQLPESIKDSNTEILDSLIAGINDFILACGDDTEKHGIRLMPAVERMGYRGNVIAIATNNDALADYIGISTVELRELSRFHPDFIGVMAIYINKVTESAIILKDNKK